MFTALLLLAACEPDDVKEDPSVAETGGEDPVLPACPDVAPPPLSTEAFERSGQLPATGLHAFATDGGYPVWVASHSTGMWRLEGEGEAWDFVEAGVTHTISEIALRPGDPDHAFRSGGGNAQRTRTGGETWDALELGVITPGEMTDLVWALSVTPWDPDRVLAVLRSGAAAVSVDDGDSWNIVGYAPIHEPPSTVDRFHVWGWRILPEVRQGGRVVFGDGFGIAVSDDGMQTFTRTLDTTLAGHSLLRDPTDHQHILVGGPDGLRESTDEGSTWTLRDIGGDILAGAWATDGSWLAFVGSTELYVSTDAGATFTATPHDIMMPSAVAILDDGTLFVADHAGVVRSDDRGATWEDISEGIEDLGVSVAAADPTCPARVYVGSRCGGGLYLSEDYGATWEPAHEFFHYVMAVVFDPSVEGRVWAVSDDRLLRTDGDGVWDEVWRRFHFHGFATHPDEPDTVLIGSVGSGDYADDRMRVYRTTDGGENWEDASTGLPESQASAHALVRWPGAPDVVLLGTYKGGDVSHIEGEGVGLWRSIDGGLTWEQAAIDVFDVSTLVPTADAVFAATNDGIWKSTDQGVTWTRGAGTTGTFLAVGFGGGRGLALTDQGWLYESADGGETWTQHPERLGQHLGTLAQIAVSADEAVAYVTVFDTGFWRIGL